MNLAHFLKHRIQVMVPSRLFAVQSVLSPDAFVLARITGGTVVKTKRGFR